MKETLAIGVYGGGGLSGVGVDGLTVPTESAANLAIVVGSLVVVICRRLGSNESRVSLMVINQ